MTENKTM